MTTIAYRSGVLAADTMLSCDGRDYGGKTAKVVRCPDGYLAAAAGYASYCHKFLMWAEHPKEEEAPTCGSEGGRSDLGVLIYKDGEITLYDSEGCYMITDAPYFAIGSGSDIAIGAMFMGADAETAVKAAIKHDCNSGGDVVLLKHAE